MFRFLAFLFGKEYEPCKSCEILKEQLIHYNMENNRLSQALIDLAKDNSERKELIDTVSSLIRPRDIRAQNESARQLIPTAGVFSRRRSALEHAERLRAQTIAGTKNLGTRSGDKYIKENSATAADNQDQSSNQTNAIMTPMSLMSTEELEHELGIEGDRDAS